MDGKSDVCKGECILFGTYDRDETVGGGGHVNVCGQGGFLRLSLILYS